MDDASATTSLMVVTDLDGTLLDHFDYSFQAAAPALERLKRLNIPLILNTSKTYTEVSAIQDALSLDTACIVENGSAVYLPDAMGAKVKRRRFEEDLRVGDHFVKLFGLSRESIVSTLHRLREESGFLFEGFSDWEPETVSSITGLSVVDARKAMIRHFSEPIVWNDSEQHYQAFVAEIKKAGLMLLKGGRFIHVMGRCDKGKTMSWLKSLYETAEPDAEVIKVVALGDSQNDVAMLELADIAVVVKSPSHEFPLLSQSSGEVIYTELDGPKGWNDTIMNILDRYDSATVNTNNNTE